MRILLSKSTVTTQHPGLPSDLSHLDQRSDFDVTTSTLAISWRCRHLGDPLMGTSKAIQRACSAIQTEELLS